MTEKIRWRFKSLNLQWKYLAADTGYSSGENYAYLEQRGIESFRHMVHTKAVPKDLNISGKEIIGYVRKEKK